MGISFGSRLKHAWNVFRNKDPSIYANAGPSYYYNYNRPRLSGGNERSIVNAIYNRIAVDVSLILFRHVRVDENNAFIEVLNSKLNNCLETEANMDQSGRQFIHDVVLSMLDEGVVAITPIDTTLDPKLNTYEILTMRTGSILDWYAEDVKVRVYNERSAKKEDVLVPKKMVAIVENPFYSVMNERNSIAQRLVRKLNMLDTIDERYGSDRLDLIIQLPYIIKSEARKQQAEARRKDVESQLAGSKYGIAYTDGSEHITQLNRPVENNLMEQVEYLTRMLFSQLGMTQSVLDGTADEKTLNNYFHMTIEPIASAIVDEMQRKFLTKTARTQKQAIMYFRDPFRLIPVSELAELSDKLARNEIMTSNELRQRMGMKPSDDPAADQLRNKNMPIEATGKSADAIDNVETKEEIQNEV